VKATSVTTTTTTTTTTTATATATAGEDVATLVINPRREGRNEPRVIKDLQDTYRKMVLPRRQLRRRPDLEKR
jgi:hypothetical protein